MDIKDVENLANLSRLELKEEEKEPMLKDMLGILEYVKQIESVKVPETHIEPELRNVWREDDPSAISRDFSVEKIIEQFPESQNRFLKVKKIL